MNLAKIVGKLVGGCAGMALLAAGLCGSARAAQPLTKPAKITFDQAGVLLVDGVKRFPIGLTIVPGPDA